MVKILKLPLTDKSFRRHTRGESPSPLAFRNVFHLNLDIDRQSVQNCKCQVLHIRDENILIIYQRCKPAKPRHTV